MNLPIQIRKLEKSDLDDCIALFRDTVHAINSQDYNPSQLNAWAPVNIDKNSWWKSLSKNIAYVAECHGQFVGFGDMSHEGYFDRLFVHKNFQRKGIASALIKKIEEEAKLAGIQEVHTEVSITAKPLMEAMGYQLIKQQIKEHNGQQFVNFIMKKSLNKKTYTISYDSKPNHDDTTILWQGISEHAKNVRDLDPGKSFAFFIRDAFNNIKGGCSGYIYYGCLYVDLLWVDETLRGKDYGTQLMQNAEKLAQDSNCNFVAVNTMDFEALAFYQKLGFVVEFERKGFNKNSSMYFLRKDLEKK